MASVMTRAMAMSIGESLASSNCSISCSCKVWPCWSLKSLLRSSSPDQAVSDRSARMLAPGFVRDFDFGRFAQLRQERSTPSSSAVFLLDDSRRLVALADGLRRPPSSASSSPSSITLVSSVSRTCACRSSEGKLQQPDRLLQLRRHGQLLADAKLQTWLQHNSSIKAHAYSLKSWPKYTSRTCGLARI